MNQHALNRGPPPTLHPSPQSAERELDLLTRAAGRADHQLQALQAQLDALRAQHPAAAAAASLSTSAHGLPLPAPAAGAGAEAAAGTGVGAAAAASAEAGALQVRLVAAEARRQLAEERCQDLASRVQVRVGPRMARRWAGSLWEVGLAMRVF